MRETWGPCGQITHLTTSLHSFEIPPFEDYNGDLKGNFHGSQNIQGQVRKNVQ